MVDEKGSVAKSEDKSVNSNKKPKAMEHKRYIETIILDVSDDDDDVKITPYATPENKNKEFTPSPYHKVGKSKVLMYIFLLFIFSIFDFNTMSPHAFIVLHKKEGVLATPQRIWCHQGNYHLVHLRIRRIPSFQKLSAMIGQRQAKRDNLVHTHFSQVPQKKGQWFTLQTVIFSPARQVNGIFLSIYLFNKIIIFSYYFFLSHEKHHYACSALMNSSLHQH